MTRSTGNPPTEYQHRTDAIPTLACAALLLAATPALAVDVPSGQSVELYEVLVDDLGTETWLRFRFLAPAIDRKGEAMPYAQVEPDMLHLCENLAIPYIAEHALEGEMIVISLADRPVEFGQSDPEATQFFEAYRPEGTSCIWEGL